MNTLNRLMIAAAFGSLVVIVTGMMAPPFASADFDTSYDVACYIGNPSNNKNVGTITVSDITSAGSLCNATFIVCQGKCVGCVNDFELDGTVCYDNNGKKFLQ